MTDFELSRYGEAVIDEVLESAVDPLSRLAAIELLDVLQTRFESSSIRDGLARLQAAQ